MYPQSQGCNSPSLNLPLKRKRGRPRKDESPMQGENKTITSGSVGAVEVDDDMVGKVVTGVIEGSFDAGYLLNVKVGSTGSNLRGVVFLPGRFSPITAANDVAPHAKMYERKELSIPVCNPPPSFYSAVSPPGDTKQSDKENIEFKNHASPLSSQTMPSEPKLSISITTEKPSGLFVGALDDNLQKNVGNLCMDSSVPNQIQGSELASQPVSVVERTNCDKVAVLDNVLQDFGISTMVKGSNMKMEVFKEASVSEQASQPISMVPDVETLLKESQNQHQAMSSEEKHNELVDDGLKVLKLGADQTPAVSVTEYTNELHQDLIDNQDSPKKDTLNQSELELATENIPVGRPGGDDTFVTECGLLSAVETNQPICIVEQDVPVVPKVTAEVFYCPGLFESRPCISSGPVGDMECDVGDSIEKSIHPEFTEPQLFISAGAGSQMECDVKDTIPPTQF